MTKILFIFLLFLNAINAQQTITVIQYGPAKPLSIANIKFDSIIEKSNQTLFYCKALREPDKTVLIIDTVAYKLFPFWIEPENKNLSIYIDNRREQEVWIDKPSKLNKLSQIYDRYMVLIQAQTDHFPNTNFDSLHASFLSKFIIDNKDNYIALYCLGNLKLLLPDSLFQRHVQPLDSSLFKYSMYKIYSKYYDERSILKVRKKGDLVTYYGIQNQEGKPYSPTKKPKLLILWKTNCGPCKRIFPPLLEYIKTHQTFEPVFIDFEFEQDKWKSKSQELQIPSEHNFIDQDAEYGRLFKSLNIYAFPSYMLLNENDQFIFKEEGVDALPAIIKMMDDYFKKGN